MKIVKITVTKMHSIDNLKVPLALFTILLTMMPIGTGAAANLWSAIALDWKTDGDMVALVTGILSGFISAVGCVVGGYIVDRKGVWFTHLGRGSILHLLL